MTATMTEETGQAILGVLREARDELKKLNLPAGVDISIKI